MPLRINLLAEAQEAEQLRRKDPVKRATYAAGFLVFCVLLWSSTLQLKIVAARSTLGGMQTQWQAIEKNYQEAVETRQRALETESKLAALQNYTTNRPLWGSALDALQMSLEGVDAIQVIRLKTEQSYAVTEAPKPRSGGADAAPARPATATEKLQMTIEALDASPQPGGNVNKFKETLLNVPYFQTHLEKTNGVRLTSLSAPQTGPLARTPYVLFTFQCAFPEKVR